MRSFHGLVEPCGDTNWRIVQVANILGRACFNYWPPSKIGPFAEYPGVGQLTPAAPALKG